MLSARTTLFPQRIPRSHIALALVGLVAAIQTVLILVWLQAGLSEGALPDTGSVAITSEPTGAAVMVDAEMRGTTPLQLSLAPGAHRVTLGSGAEVHSREITVGRGTDATLHVGLKKEESPPRAAAPPVATEGTLEISTKPAGGRVSVDGRARGIAPITVTDLAPGPHVISVNGPSGSLTQTANVRAGTVTSVVVAMSAKPEFGWVAVSSAVPLQIYDGSRLIGSSEASRVMLSADKYQLELVNADLNFRVRKSVQIVAGKTSFVEVSLPTAVVHLNALPWAEVSMGSRVIGETPIANLALPIGTHELTFRHPDFGEQRRTVTVRAGEPARIGVDLRRAQP